MKTPYDDIIHLPHPVSSKRKRMSMVDRAAQFSPFAALTGYEAAIAETGRLTDAGFEHACDGTELLNRKIRLLSEHLSEHPQVEITYFLPDPRKSGGAYREVRCALEKIDSQCQRLILEDGTQIPFDRIYELDCDLFSAGQML